MAKISLIPFHHLSQLGNQFALAVHIVNKSHAKRDSTVLLSFLISNATRPYSCPLSLLQEAIPPYSEFSYFLIYISYGTCPL